MIDVIESDDMGRNNPEFNVSEISAAIKRVVEGEFSHVRVRGEIGRVSFPRSGHVYLDLKDERSVLSGVIWKGVAARLSMRPEEGLEVVATGRITTFGGQSKYQLVIEDMKPAGVGALMAMLEKRKALLASEGLFDAARKKQIPFLPDVIGVITSPSGAVIRDIMHRLRDRFPRKVLLWPVAVQGEKCASDVSNAIKGFNALEIGGAVPRPDVLIVARGGGSLEDLWGFNEESVARAAAASDIPLISAVGHETDTTLIDFVSDQRAPTPTAAAELAVPVRHELVAWVSEQGARSARALSTGLGTRRQRLADLSRALPRAESLFQFERQELDALSERMPLVLRSYVEARCSRLSEIAGALRPSAAKARLESAADRLHLLAPRLGPALTRSTQNHQRSLTHLATRLSPQVIERNYTAHRTQYNYLAKGLAQSAERQMQERTERLAALERLRETLGYKATLKRGYAVVRADDGIVTTKNAAKAAKRLEVEFKDGRLLIAGEQDPDQTSRPRKSTRIDRGIDKPDQGSLF